MDEMAIPANTQAEEGVLACILYQPRNLARVIDTLRPEHFSGDEHRRIYEAMCTLAAEGRTITPFMVSTELSRGDASSHVTTFALEEMKSSILTLERIEHYADALRATGTFRRLYALAGYIAGEALHQEKGAIERITQRLDEIALDMDIRQPATLEASLERYMAILDKRRDNYKKGIDNALSTGIAQLDRLMRLKKSKLYLLAAQTSIGKSAIALNIAFNAISHAHHAIFFSLEMDEDELIQRLIAMDTPIDQTLLDSGDVSDEEYELVRQAKERLQHLDMRIEDQVYLLSAIAAISKQVHARKKLDLIVIDYLQIMDVPKSERGKDTARYQEVGAITKALKRLARDLKVPILLLSQLSRKSGEHAIPQLSDIYESSRVEQDADNVMLAYIEESEEAKRQASEPYIISVRVGKQRNGRIGTAKIYFRPRITKAESLVEDRYVPSR